MKDFFTTDFTHPLFQAAFQEYFKELDVNVSDWDQLFREMSEDGEDKAIIRIADDNKIAGFILFKTDTLANWFFEETVGFIREFWVSREFRRTGQGSQLLALAEQYFIEHSIYKSILTTDTAPDFYISQHYVKDFSYHAKNEDEVFIKLLK